MKIDVEGFEEAFLEGAWGIVQRDRPVLVLEFNVGRCTNPAGLIDQLEALYSPIQVITRDSRAIPADRSRLLDKARVDDWMLYLEA